MQASANQKAGFLEQPIHLKASNSGYCFFQYTFVHLGSLILLFWWAASSVNLFCLIVLEKTAAEMELLQRIISGVCWGLPLLVSRPSHSS
jgi:hypothetical protein